MARPSAVEPTLRATPTARGACVLLADRARFPRNKPCGGVQLHVTNPEAFRPYLTGVAFLKACYDQSPASFRWREKAYEFVDQIPAIDLLAGGDAVRKGIEAGAALADLSARWPRYEGDFAAERADYLLYE